MSEQDQIEELAKLMWASWGGRSPDLPWNRLPETHQFKYKTQAELLIDNGYRRDLKPINKEDLFNLTIEIAPEDGRPTVMRIPKHWAEAVWKEYGSSPALQIYEFITKFCEGIKFGKEDVLTRSNYVMLPSERRLFAEQFCAKFGATNE